MKLVMTLLVRNEADVVDAQLAFHLAAGVDFVLATDNRSDDGTTEILERYERAGRLLLLHEPGDDMRQAEWVTRMARLAAVEHGADWVVNSDADEFWWPRGGSLKDVLSLVPERYGVVRGAWRHFLPRPESAGADVFERMTVRLCAPAHPGDKATIHHAHQKVAHRGVPDVEVEPGNHDVRGSGLEPLRGWHPMEILHFSLRSPSQVESKSRGGWLRNPGYEATLHQTRLDRARATSAVDRFFEQHVVDDELLEAGLGAGTLAIDTRLRDALRQLRGAGGFRVAGLDERLLEFGTPSVEDSAAFVAEIAPLLEIDGAVRAEARADALERRLQALERAWPRPLGRAFALRAGPLVGRRRLARR